MITYVSIIQKYLNLQTYLLNKPMNYVVHRLNIKATSKDAMKLRMTGFECHHCAVICRAKLTSDNPEGSQPAIAKDSLSRYFIII